MTSTTMKWSRSNLSCFSPSFHRTLHFSVHYFSSWGWRTLSQEGTRREEPQRPRQTEVSNCSRRGEAIMLVCLHILKTVPVPLLPIESVNWGLAELICRNLSTSWLILFSVLCFVFYASFCYRNSLSPCDIKRYSLDCWVPQSLNAVFFQFLYWL